MTEDEQTEVEGPQIIQCIYASAAIESFDREELTALLAKARANNEQCGVTGMLLYHEASFFQVLEGEESAVHRLFNRISADTRHAQVIKLIEEPVDERHFASWTMGYAGLTKEELDTFPGMNDFYTERRCFTQLEAGRARVLLEQFRAGRWRQKLEQGPTSIPARAYGLF